MSFQLVVPTVDTSLSEDVLLSREKLAKLIRAMLHLPEDLASAMARIMI